MLLIANHRSGTHAFGALLEAHSNGVAWYRGEVFNPDLQEDHGFYNWLLHTSAISLEEFTLKRDRALSREAAEHYYNYIFSAGRLAVLDVKLSNLHALDPLSRFRFEPPSLLTTYMDTGRPVVFVKRRSVFRSYVSELYKIASGVDHFFIGETVDEPDEDETSDLSDLFLEPDPSSALTYVSQVRREYDFLDQVLDGYDRKLVIDYEDLFEGEGLSPRALSALRQLTRLDLSDSASTQYRRTPVDYPDLIANRVQLLERFNGSEYAEDIAAFFE